MPVNQTCYAVFILYLCPEDEIHLNMSDAMKNSSSSMGNLYITFPKMIIILKQSIGYYQRISPL